MYKYIAIVFLSFIVGCGTSAGTPSTTSAAQQQDTGGSNPGSGTSATGTVSPADTTAAMCPAMCPAGPAGNNGAKGDKGDPGAAGATGAEGPMGPQGPVGNTGATGSQGPQGSVGSQGLMGPAGAAGTSITKSSLYVVTGATTPVNPNAGGTSSATCSQGLNDFVLHGSCSVSLGLFIENAATSNETNLNADAFYHCDVWNTTGQGGVVTASAVCVHVP